MSGIMEDKHKHMTYIGSPLIILGLVATDLRYLWKSKSTLKKELKYSTKYGTI